MTTPAITRPTMVRNTASGPTVFAAAGQNVEWQGAGDPMGRDLQPVPESFLSSVEFHQATARGIFVIEAADDRIAEALSMHRQEWEGRLQQQRAASQDSIDQAPMNDSLVKGCIGPSGKAPNQLCGVDVPIKAAKLAENPPLCPMHTGLAGQFIAQEGEKIIEGKPEVVWVKARLAAPTRQD